MSLLQFVSRSGSLKADMPKIYYCCHPDDFDAHFRELCADLFSVNDYCAVFYEAKPNEGYDAEELLSLLGGMKLFVVPVTEKLLSQPSRATGLEIPFALGSLDMAITAEYPRIPVLPILLEEDLIDRFNGSKVFSGIQFLNKTENDATAIGYREKLEKYLNAVLVSADDLSGINAQFAAKLFLSYRKKDRELARELMKRIHDYDICRDVAIWYDEFLTPGESFEDNIMEQLNNCDLFMMSVSPSFEEPENYVRQHEYPEARRKNKSIVAAQMSDFDENSLSNLEELYPGIGKLMIDAADTQKLGEHLKNGLLEAGLDEEALRRSDPEHLYYMGLAFKAGVMAEANPTKAIGLFEQAFGGGYVKACLEPIRMYRLGDGVKADPEKALDHCEKAIGTLSPMRGSEEMVDDTLARVYHEKGEIHNGRDEMDETLDAYKNAYEIRRQMAQSYEDAPLCDYCDSVCYLALVYYSFGQFKEAMNIAVKFAQVNNIFLYEDTEELEYLRIAQRICHLLAETSIHLKKRQDAQTYREHEVALCEKIESLSGAADDLKNLESAYIGLSDLYKQTDFDKAGRYLEKYRQIKERMNAFGGSAEITLSAAIDTFRIADNTLMQALEPGMTEKAQQLYDECFAMCDALKDTKDGFEAQLLKAKIYDRYATLAQLQSDSTRKRLELFEEKAQLCKQLEKIHRRDLRVMHRLSEAYDSIGMIYFKQNFYGYENAINYFMDALEYDLRTARIAKDPGSKHNLAKSYLWLSEINSERGHDKLAVMYIKNALRILEPLAEETDDYKIMEDLALGYFRLGGNETLTADVRIGYCEKAQDVYQKLNEMTSGMTEYARNYDAVKQLADSLR